MFCGNCGASNADEFLFCAACGSPLAKPSAQNSVTYQSASDPVSSPVVVPKERGNVAQAWADITGSPNWLKRLFLLLIMNCVPVLDLYVKGYSLQWGAQAARGKAEPLAPGVFTKKTLLYGLVPFLLKILAFLGSIVLWAFSVIPIIGVLFTLAGCLLADAFTRLAVMRVGATGRMGSAFDLSELFRVYRKNMGGLVFASAAPVILGGIVVIIVSVVLFALAGIDSYSSMRDVGGHYGYYDYYYDPFDLVFGSVGMVVAFALVGLLSALIQGAVELWTMRAVGYWVFKNAPEWVEQGSDAENPFKAAKAAPVEQAPAE